MQYCYIAIISFVLFLMPSALCNAFMADNAPDEISMLTIGKGKILNKNIDAGKKSALKDALSCAVEQAAMKMLSPSESASGLEFIYDTGQTLADQFIVTYKILGELQRNNDYIVAVESSIASKKIKTLLTQNNIKSGDGNFPGIMFFITEQAPGEILPRYWWGKNPLPYHSDAEKALIDVMANEKYRVVASGDNRPSLENSDITFNAVNDKDAAIGLAREFNAGFVVMGKALAAEESNIMGDERSYKAVLSLKVYAVKSGDEIIAFEKDAVVKGTNVSEAVSVSLTLAGRQAGETLAVELEGKWGISSTSGPQVIVTKIEGTDYLSSFIMLRKTLNDMSGIKDVLTKELSSDQAFVDIVFQGNAKKLADALMLKTFDSFGLVLSDVTLNSLTIRFVPKNSAAPIEKSDIEGAYISE